MARKRLSDLLREEVQKPTEGKPEPEQPEVVEKQEKAIATNDSSKLESAQQREAELNHQITNLNQQISDLKTELETQTTSTEKLQTNLETTQQRNHQLETELAQVKQTALQLAESNAQLKAQLQQHQEAAQAQPKRTVAPVSKPVAPASKPDDKLAARPLTQQEILRRQADSLAHPIFPTGNNPGQLSEQDIGWVD